MYQLPPGFVPVLVSNTGSLQPLVSIPPQQPPQNNPPPPQTIEVAAASTLSVPQQSQADQGRRSSSTLDPQQMVLVQPQQPPPQQSQSQYPDQQQQMMMIMPDQQQQQQQPQQTVIEQPPVPYPANSEVVQPVQPQYSVPSEVVQPVQPQYSVPSDVVQPVQPQYSVPSDVVQPVQPQYSVPSEVVQPVQPQYTVPSEVVQPVQPQYTVPTEVVQPVSYSAAPEVAQQPLVEATPDPIYVQAPQTSPQPVPPPPSPVSDIGYIPGDASNEAHYVAAQPEAEPTAAAAVAQLSVDPNSHLLDPAAAPTTATVPSDEAVEENSPSPLPQSGVETYEMPPEGLEAVLPSVADEDSVVSTQGKDVSDYESPRILIQQPSFVVMHPSSSLYSSTSSLSSSCFSCDPSFVHAAKLQHFDEYQHLNPNAAMAFQLRKSSVPTASPTPLITAEALLRRGSLPPSIILNPKSEIEMSNSRLTSRRSSSGTIAPLATLREGHAGDSDLSIEDLSQVSFATPAPKLQLFCIFLKFCRDFLVSNVGS